jgi:hypothetical protein
MGCLRRFSGERPRFLGHEFLRNFRPRALFTLSFYVNHWVLVHGLSSFLRSTLSHCSARLLALRGWRRLHRWDSSARKRFGFVAKLPLPEPRLRYEEIPLTARAEVTGQTLRAARIEKCSRATGQNIAPHLSRTRCRSDRACHSRGARLRITPTYSAWFRSLRHTSPAAALNSHGWRFRLVRHSHGSDRPTRVEPENTVSSGLSQKRKTPSNVLLARLAA